MKVDVARLRGKIVERGTTQQSLANALNMDKTTFSRKMTGDALGFSIEDMHGMARELSLTADEAKEIFLFDNSHYCES